MGPTIISTERLNLRTWTPGDVDNIIALFADPEVARFITDGKPVSHDEAAEFVTRNMRIQRERGWCRWAVELAEEPGFLAGFCGPGCTFAPEIEVGWTLRKAAWGKGYATEAARAAIDYCFNTMGFARIISAVDPKNVRSAAVAQRMGMTPDGTLHHDGHDLSRYVLHNPDTRPIEHDDPRLVTDCDGERSGSSLVATE